MIRDQLILDTNHELIIDNFAGGGGASSGIEEALGRHVDHAINHDPIALGMHRINHPQTVHHCEDIFDIDPYKLTGAVTPAASSTLPRPGRSVGFAWFSPDCKHFSKAKGGKPLNKKIRGLALIMLRYAATVRPRVMAMENVEEIQTWGPLYPDHNNGCKGGNTCRKSCHYQRPIPEHKGRTWNAFLAALGSGLAPNHPDVPEILAVLNEPREGSAARAASSVPKHLQITKAQLARGFGYQYETKELRACDYGAPTIRKRLFMICRCDGLPIVWPKPTHCDPKLRGKSPSSSFSSSSSTGKLKPWEIIADCIDWSLPCPSIFLNEEQARKAKCRRPLKRNTLRRIAAGVDRYVLKAEKPFIISLTHQGGDRVEPVDEPARTLTGANRGEKALVAPVIGRCAHGEPRGKGAHPATEPMGTQPASKDFSLIETQLAPFVSDSSRPQEERNSSANRPGPTHCAEVKRGHLQIIAPAIVRQFGQSVGQGVQSPAPTTMPGGQGKTALVTGAIVGCGGRASQSRPRKLDEPQHTGTAKADTCLVSGVVVGAGGPARAGEPRPVTKPAGTLLVKNDSHIVGATLIQTGYGEREGQAPRVPGIEKPLGTVVAGGGKHAVIAANMIEYHSTSKGGSERAKPLDAPLPVQDTNPRVGLVAAHLTKFTTGSDGKPLTEPSPTVVAGSHSPETHGGAASTLGIVAANMIKMRGTNIGSPASDPVHTMSAGGTHHGLVQAELAAGYIAQHNAGFNTNPGHPATDPASTISAKGSQQQVVSAQLAKPGSLENTEASDPSPGPGRTQQQIVAASAVAYYGSETDGQGMSEPMRTATVKPRLALSTAHGVEMTTPVIHLLTEEQMAGARRVAKFLRSFGVKFDTEFAMVGDYVIVDLGMRMLVARELFRAQGFQDSYTIDRAWLVHEKTGEVKQVNLTKEAQIRMCGNSVSPPCARAITAANVPELAVWNQRERKSANHSFRLSAFQTV